MAAAIPRRNDGEVSERAGPAPDGSRAPGLAGQGDGRRPEDFPADWPPGRQRWQSGPPPWGGAGPWRRSRADRLAGGVAAGLAARTGINVTVVRIVFVLAALPTGFGAAAYVAAWLLVPADGEPQSIGTRALADRRGIALAAALASLMVMVMVAGSVLQLGWLGSALWPLTIGVAGLTLIWRNGPRDEQEVLRRLAEPLLGIAGGRTRSRSLMRLAAAAALLGGGLAMLLAGQVSGAALRPLGGLMLVIAAFIVLLGPWWLGIARDLVVERQARARAEERAELAARVHDSVLQTLALIQRRASDPQQVIQLARAQERELRSWLFDGRPPGPLAAEDTTLAAGVRRIQQDVEVTHGVSVEVVIVGDCELDDALGALLAAAREATVNAAKWSGAPVISLFAEVEPGQVSLFVRDRGRGFDPAAVAADRKGLAESVHARMARHGGSAAVRSAGGEGTEVSLTMPREAGKTQLGPA
jgi:signal transduction histidine kinase/phage shock protein PspC (stress-responsive transcriptional regulator)